MSRPALAAAAILLAGAPAAAGQAQVLTQHNLSLALARTLAESALAACRSGGYQVSVTVVDRAGQTRFALRDDDSKPHTFDASQRKAFTALTFRRPSSELEKDPASAPLAAMPGVFLRAGGLPVRAGGEVIGAIGVAGAPGGVADEVCARAALDKAGELK